MDYQALKDELTNDPLGRLYSGMDDAAAAASLNTVDRQVPRTAMSASEVFNAIDSTEWNALTATDQQKIWDVLHMGGDLNPFGRESDIFIEVFPGAGVTLTALNAARQRDVSRAQELGFGVVREGDVQFARTL